MGEDRARMTGADDMSKRPRRNHSAAFKAKVAIEALADGKTIARWRSSTTSTPIR